MERKPLEGLIAIGLHRTFLDIQVGADTGMGHSPKQPTADVQYLDGELRVSVQLQQRRAECLAHLQFTLAEKPLLRSRLSKRPGRSRVFSKARNVFYQRLSSGSLPTSIQCNRR